MSVPDKFGARQFDGVGKKELYGFIGFQDFVQVDGDKIRIAFPFPVQSNIVVVHYGLDGGIASFPILCQVQTSVELLPKTFGKGRVFIGVGMVPIVEIKGGQSFVRLVVVGKVLPNTYLVRWAVQSGHNLVGVLSPKLGAQE